MFGLFEFVYFLQESRWKDPPVVNRISGNRSSSPVDDGKSRSSQERRREISTKTDNNAHQISSRQLHENETETAGYAFDDKKRKSYSVTSDWSKTSMDSGRHRGSGGSHDQLYGRNIYTERYDSKSNFAKQANSTSSSNRSTQPGKVPSSRIEASSRNASKSSKEEIDSPPMKVNSSFDCSQSFDNHRQGSQSSSEGRHQVGFQAASRKVDIPTSWTEEWQNRKNESIEEISQRLEVNDDARVPASKRYSRKLQLDSGHVQTSPPQKSDWPVSPIKQRADKDVSCSFFPS